jgi:hypothetical protein
MVTPQIVGMRHYRIAQEIRKTLASYEELKDIFAMLGLEELSHEDATRCNAPGAWSASSHSRFSSPSSSPDAPASW